MRKLLLLFIGISLFACNRNVRQVEYTVRCGSCQVSYWDADNEFVPRINASGEWTYSFEAADEDHLELAAQSQLCQDQTACNDSLQLLQDSVYVSITIDGNLFAEDKVGNQEFATALVLEEYESGE